MVKLRGQLLVHRDRLGQSSLLVALRQGSHATFDVVQLRPSLFRLAPAALYCLDGSEQAFPPAGRVLRGGLFLRERDLYLVNLGTDQTSRRRSLASPQEHALPFNRDSMSLRNRIAGRLEISLSGSWNLLLLPHRLSAASRARDGGFVLTEFSVASHLF